MPLFNANEQEPPRFTRGTGHPDQTEGRSQICLYKCTNSNFEVFRSLNKWPHHTARVFPGEPGSSALHHLHLIMMLSFTGLIHFHPDDHFGAREREQNVGDEPTGTSGGSPVRVPTIWPVSENWEQVIFGHLGSRLTQRHRPRPVWNSQSESMGRTESPTP